MEQLFGGAIFFSGILWSKNRVCRNISKTKEMARTRCQSRLSGQSAGGATGGPPHVGPGRRMPQPPAKQLGTTRNQVGLGCARPPNGGGGQSEKVPPTLTNTALRLRPLSVSSVLCLPRASHDNGFSSGHHFQVSFGNSVFFDPTQPKTVSKMVQHWQK